MLMGCNAADQSELFGFLDFNDVLVFLVNFSNAEPVADLALPIGIDDFNDVVVFLTLFAQG